MLASGGELLFCGHHGRQYDNGLRKIAADIHDETDRLSETLPTAALEER